MKYAILIFALFFLVAGISSRAGDFTVPEIPDGEVRIYKGYYAREKDRPDEDDPLTKDLRKFMAVKYTVTTRWEGKGDGRRLVMTRKQSLANGSKNDMTFTFNTSPKFRLESYESQLFAPDGTKVSDEYFNFTSPALKNPEDVFNNIIGHMAIHGRELSVGKQIRYNIWVSPTMVYPGTHKVVGEETITTPAGTFECYKLESEAVSEGLTDLMGIVIGLAGGKTYIWVEKGGSHGLVRVQYPVSLGFIQSLTKYRTEELIDLHKGGQGNSHE
jgi:hypothetical protein